jgi:hypothetical protein
MQPLLNLYLVFFAKLAHPFYIIAENFGDAERRAKLFALEDLEEKHQEVKSIKLVAEEFQLIGKMQRFEPKEKPCIALSST